MGDRCFVNIRINYYFLKNLPGKIICFQFKSGKLYTFLKRFPGKCKVIFRFSRKNESFSLWQPCFKSYYKKLKPNLV